MSTATKQREQTYMYKLKGDPEAQSRTCPKYKLTQQALSIRVTQNMNFAAAVRAIKGKPDGVKPTGGQPNIETGKHPDGQANGPPENGPNSTTNHIASVLFTSALLFNESSVENTDIPMKQSKSNSYRRERTRHNNKQTKTPLPQVPPGNKVTEQPVPVPASEAETPSHQPCQDEDKPKRQENVQNKAMGHITTITQSVFFLLDSVVPVTEMVVSLMGELIHILQDLGVNTQLFTANIDGKKQALHWHAQNQQMCYNPILPSVYPNTVSAIRLPIIQTHGLRPTVPIRPTCA